MSSSTGMILSRKLLTMPLKPSALENFNFASLAASRVLSRPGTISSTAEPTKPSLCSSTTAS